MLNQNQRENATSPATPKINRRHVLVGAVVAGLSFLTGGTADAASRKKKATTTKKKVATATPTTKPVAAVASGPAFSDTQEMLVTWTYTATGGGRIHNPYVAVWVEDGAGAPVAIVHLEFQLNRGDKWLKDIKRWSRADEALVALGATSSSETTTQGTRLPGTYSTVWNGKNAQGAPVPHGTYTVWVEAAREKGPYQYAKDNIVIGEAPTKTVFKPVDELTAVSVELRTKK
jgi:hypothetical protein